MPDITPIGQSLSPFIRTELERLSKAELLGLVWDYAVRERGDGSVDGAYFSVVRAHQLLAGAEGRTPTDITPDLTLPAQREFDRIERQFADTSVPSAAEQQERRRQWYAENAAYVAHLTLLAAGA